MRLIDADKITAYIDIEYEDKSVDVDDIPTIEAIPKDQYEARLKADMVAMLTDIQLEIENCEIPREKHTNYISREDDSWNEGLIKAQHIIQEKINALGGNKND